MSDIKIDSSFRCNKCEWDGRLVFITMIPNDNYLDTKMSCPNCLDIKTLDGDCTELVDKTEVKSEAIKSDERPSKYHIKNVFKHKDWVDWYDIERGKRATGIIIDPAIEHASKKLFVNDRGHKDELTDIDEAIWSLQNAREEILRLRELKNNEQA